MTRDAGRALAGPASGWREAAAREDLLEALAASSRPLSASAIEALRREAGAELAPFLLDLAEARRKALRKWPDRPRLIACPEAIEQASSALAARHKAARFAALDPRPARVLDLCAGAGGDAIALAERGLCVIALDRDPTRAWMARQNAGCAAAAIDVSSISLRGEVIHLDPGRRRAGRRLHDYADYEPGPAFIERALAEARAAAVKLGPGVAFADLPALARHEVEVLAEPQGLTQAVLWAGALCRHPGQRTATRLPQGASLTGFPGAPPPRAIGRYVVECDPAVERADLSAALAARLGGAFGSWHDPRLGLLTGDAPPRPDPLARAFEVIDAMPWREKHVRAALRAHGARSLEVKTRGQAANADEVHRTMTARLASTPSGAEQPAATPGEPGTVSAAGAPGEAGGALVLLIVRLGRQPFAVIARRLAAAD